MLQLLLLALDKSTVWDAAVTASSTRQKTRHIGCPPTVVSVCMSDDCLLLEFLCVQYRSEKTGMFYNVSC